MGQSVVGESINNSTTSSVETLEAVSSLQSNSAEAIAAKRKHRRFDIRLKVIIRPGDCIARADTRWLGECHDISQGGCRLLTKLPLQIGSIYWVTFEPNKKANLEPLFARCVRGNLLREDAFEFGMCFLMPIDLPDDNPEDELQLL